MRSKLPSPKILAAFLACLALMLACSLVTGSPDEPSAPPSEEPQEPQPAASNTPRPTDPPKPTSTTAPTVPPPPPDDPLCYKWDQITLDMAGEEVCVYGVAYSHQGKSRIDFSPEKNSFFLIDANYYYPNLAEGVCVVAIQDVEVFDGKIPFMTINGDLKKCLDWMEE
jgi:hypothetical protein